MGEGDRVVAYMPNIPEAMAAFLATASLGAIWSSCSPDFGARTVVDRFAQIEPKVLLAVDGYRYGGRDFDKSAVVAELEAAMPTLEHTVVLPYLGAEADVSALRSALGWDAMLARGDGAALTFRRVPFSHPLWVLYSSGTTGLPKAIVHGHGGILLEHLKKMWLHLDAQQGDRVFWFTTTGWMMWNFLAGVLLTDAAIVLYDGNPGHPTLDRLWDLAEETRTTCFGTSASFLASCMKGGVQPREGRDLSALRSVGSTGSPLSPEGFRWVYDELGEETWLFSTSGGTDVCTAFVGGVPVLPVYEGELQGRALGAKVEAFDEDGDERRGGGGRARDHRADAVDAGRVLERPGRSAAARRVLRDVPGHLAPRRLDPHHRARHGDHLRALGLDDQPRRRADGHVGDLRRRARRAADRRRARGRRAARGRGELDAALRRARRRRRRSTRTSPARSRAACARSARRVTCRARCSPSPRSRGRSPARCSRCR